MAISGHERHRLISLVLVLIVIAVTSADNCPAGCVVCSRFRAHCITNDTDPFPQTLNRDTQSIIINYQGNNSFELNASYLKRYISLSSFAISGHLDRIAENTFKNHRLTLNELSISDAFIQEVPRNMFGEYNGTTPHLSKLILSHNNMTTIPYLIDQGLGLLNNLDLSYNPFDLCKGGQSIGDQFLYMKNLEKLNLAGVGDPAQCGTINKYFFEPLQNIIQLNLSEAGFFHSINQDILLPLKKIEFLILDNVSPFNHCPLLAKQLFGNLSDSLTHLEAQRWRDASPVNASCSLIRDALAGLAKLPRLRKLDFEYGDKIFGQEISKTLFSDFKHLDLLNLAWCGISAFAEGVFSGLSIGSICLNGNSIGPREFWVYGKNHSRETLNSLYMRQCGINADETLVFNAYFISYSFPNLANLDLSRNMLLGLPRFTKPGYPHRILHRNMKIGLFGNLLSTIRNDEMLELCHVMPNMSWIDFSNNRIYLLEYLCPTVTSLEFENNQLGDRKYQKGNMEALQNLTRLTFLSLSGNGLSYLYSSTFMNMKNLRKLWIRNNNIYHLDKSLLHSNLRLWQLDLSSNELQSFNTSAIENLKRLSKLYLNKNQITQLDRDFIDFARNTTSLLNIYLADNPFDCSCGQLYFQSWVQNASNHKLVDGTQLQCDTPSELHSKHVATYEQPLFDCYFKWALIAAAIFVFVVVLVLLCYRSRWYLIHLRLAARSVSDRLKDIKRLDEYRYDAMIIFNTKCDVDVGVVKRLMIELEGDNYLEPLNHGEQPTGRENKVYIRIRDDLTGPNGLEQCCLAIEHSRKIILVLSNSFLQNDECVTESIHVGRNLFSTKRYSSTRMKVVILEDLDYDLIRDAEISSLLADIDFEDLPEDTRNKSKKMDAIMRKLRRFVDHGKTVVPEKEPRNGYDPL